MTATSAVGRRRRHRLVFTLPKSASGSVGVLATGVQSDGTATTVFGVVALDEVTIAE